MPIGSHNYCRQPETGGSGAWCYVDDPDSGKSWERCDVPACIHVSEPDSGSYDCQDLSLYHKGINYIGNTSTTASGKTCQNWNDVSE